MVGAGLKKDLRVSRVVPNATMAEDVTMTGGVDASEGDARRFHGRRC